MLRKLALALLLISGVVAFAQVSNPGVVAVGSVPSSCYPVPLYEYQAGSTLYISGPGNTCVALGSGGSSGFPIIIGSTSIDSGSTTATITGLTIDGVTPTTMGYVDPTSSIQTQLNGKQASGTYVTAVSVASANGVSGTSSGGATPALTIALGAITPTSTNGVSSTTMAYMDATSSVQTQLNGKQASGTYVTPTTLNNGSLPGLFSVLGANTEFSNGTCTTAKTITPVNGNMQNVTLTNGDACALTFTQPSSGTASITLKVIQSSTSTFNGTISGCKWPGGTTPTITSTTGAIDFVSVYLDGTNSFCAALQNFK